MEKKPDNGFYFKRICSRSLIDALKGKPARVKFISTEEAMKVGYENGGFVKSDKFEMGEPIHIPKKKTWSLGKFLKVTVIVGAATYVIKIIAEQFK